MRRARVLSVSFLVSRFGGLSTVGVRGGADSRNHRSMDSSVTHRSVESSVTSFGATSATAAAGAPAKAFTWARFHAKVNHAADGFYYRLGYWVAKHVKLTVLASIVFVILCSAGFVNFSTESSGEDLWVPKASQAKEDEAIVEPNFNDALEYAIFVVAAPEEGGNVLTKEVLDMVFELDGKIRTLETSGGFTYADLCLPETDGITCSSSVRSITRFWDDDILKYQRETLTDADILAEINVETFPDGQAVALEAIFGDSATFEAGGAVSGAEAFMQLYLMREEDDTLTWEAEYQDLMAKEVGIYADTFKLTFFTARSIDDALAESLGGEIFLFVITYIIMVVFVQCVLGRCFAGPVRRRTWLGLGGVLCVLGAGIAAFGINSAFGVPFTSLVQVLPFILIGIGVDDMFVIVAAFDHTDPALPVEERVALGLKRSGVSITYTSLTNFVAFMLGSTTSLPAVEYFCLYAGTAILFDFFLQVTAFVALLTMDANRQNAGRFDWCCCFTSRKFLEEQETVRRGVTVTDSPVVTPKGGGQGFPTTASARAAASATALASDVRIGRIGRFMKEKYTPFLLSTKGKALVLLGTTSLLAAGIYGVTQATQGFDVIDITPDDHFARDYTKSSRDYMLEFDSYFIPLNIYTLDVDYTDIYVQASIQATDELMLEQTYVQGPLQSWLVSFVEWASNSTEYSANTGISGGHSVYEDPDTFYAALADFLGDDSNARFESDVVYEEGDDFIKISRTEVFLTGVFDTDTRVDSLLDARDVADKSDLQPKPFAFSALFIFIEQFIIIYNELILNFILALVAVAILSLLVLGKISIVILVCISVAMIDAELLGFVYHYGLEINSITVIQLIMAVGLVVDYMVHIVHYFLHQSPVIPKDARIASALGEIGPSIMVGAATTFLGIMPMAFASNFIFRVFFRMFIIIISFGFYHGIVFIPMVLSLLPDRLVSPMLTTGNESCARVAVLPRTRLHSGGPVPSAGSFVSPMLITGNESSTDGAPEPQ